jgi:hypothetical protein
MIFTIKAQLLRWVCSILRHSHIPIDVGLGRAWPGSLIIKRIERIDWLRIFLIAGNVETSLSLC